MRWRRAASPRCWASGSRPSSSGWVLKHQAAVPGRAGGEAAAAQVDHVADRAKVAVIAQAGIMRQLQQDQIIICPAAAEPCKGPAPLQRLHRQQQHPPRVQPPFACHADLAMRAIAGIAAVMKQNAEMIDRPVEHVVPQRPPLPRRLPSHARASVQRAGHGVDAHGHQGRVAVGAAMLVGDPERAQIPFFEAMHGDALVPGQFDGGGVDVPGVAVKDEVGHRLPVQVFGQEEGPILPIAGVAGIGVLVAPVVPVAGVEADLVNAVPRLRQQAGKLAEKGAVRALQEEEEAAHDDDRSLWFAPIIEETS